MTKEELLIYAQDKATELVQSGGDMGEFYLYLAEAAYNRALDDAMSKSYLSDQTDLEGHLIRVVDEIDIERLKINGE